MRDAEKTVGNMIDKLKTAFIGSIDSEGFPNMKDVATPKEGRDKDNLSDYKYFVNACGPIS